MKIEKELNFTYPYPYIVIKYVLMKKVDIAFGFSPNTNAEEAVREASVALRSRLTIPKIELCLVFFSLPRDEVRKLSYNIKRILNPHTIMGCSLPFLISGNDLHKRGVIIVGFSGIEVASGAFSEEHDILEASEKFIWRISRQAHNKRKALFLSFSRLDTFSASDFLKGIERGVGRNIPCLGLFSCEDQVRQETLLLYNENILTKGAIGALFFTGPDIFLSIDSGFSPLGKGGKVTSFDKKVIREIDNRPAVRFYRDYFGEKILTSRHYFRKAMTRYPLGFRLKDHTEYVVGSPLKANPDGSLVFLKDILSEEIKLMIPVRDTLLQAVERSAEESKGYIFDPKLALLFDSFSRHKFLGTYYSKQLEVLQYALDDTPLLGGGSFYSMGSLQSSKIELGHFIFENSYSFLLLGTGQ